MRYLKFIAAASAIAIALLFVTMVQPSYFLAKPSLYSLFSAVVADRNVSVERDVSYASHSRLKLDIYSPDSAALAAKSPIVLFLYGGTWKEGDRAIYGFVGAALAARGMTAVIPDYRLFPEVQFPEFLNDAAKAYVWTRRRFADTKQPVFIMGHSAGAHMAAMLALNSSYIRGQTPDLPMPDGLIGLAGPYAFDLTTYRTTKDLFVADQVPEATIPANFVTEDAPPALLLHGSKDETVKPHNMSTLAAKLTAVGAVAQTHLLDDVTHVSLIRDLAWPFRNATPALDLIDRFVLQREQTATR